MKSDSAKYDRNVLRHEMGHHVVCHELGYPSVIDIDPDTEIYALRHTITDNTEKELKDHLTMTFGGMLAEQICGIKETGGLGDMFQARELLKELYTRQGKKFEWDTVKVPIKEYAPFIKRALSILKEKGGRENLEGLVDQMLNDWKEMPNKWKAPAKV